ncbi:hypothetical protein QBC39DRAFT_329705 [Podospora conica]|nr:hypothetical protein QBC39DRAFT_329705 [Schizothecium conicum]
MASRSASGGGGDPSSSSAAPAVGPAGKPPIPPLVSVVPAIFTPMPEDMFDFIATPKNLADEPLRDRVARLRHIIATIDDQRAGVRDNMLYMFDRDKERWIQEAEDREAAEAAGRAPPMPPGLPYAEVDEFVAAMEAPADPRVNYCVGREELRQMTLGHRSRGPQRAMTAREVAMEHVFRVVDSSLGELVGYDGHIMNFRRKYAERLEKEEALISEAGLRPEERVLGR